MTEEGLKQILEECRANDSYSKLVHTLGHVFPNPELLGRSFVGPLSGGNPILPAVATAVGQLSKEQLRSMEVDLDKDKDSQEALLESSSSSSEKHSPISVDVYAVRRIFEALNAVDSSKYESALVHALTLLCDTLELDLKYNRLKPEINLLNVFVIAFELPWIGSGDYFDKVLPSLCRACALLPLSQQAALVRFWAAHCTSNLRNLVQSLQQLISFRVLSGDFSRDYAVNDDDTITACVKVLKLPFRTNILWFQFFKMVFSSLGYENTLLCQHFCLLIVISSQEIVGGSFIRLDGDGRPEQGFL